MVIALKPGRRLLEGIALKPGLWMPLRNAIVGTWCWTGQSNRGAVPVRHTPWTRPANRSDPRAVLINEELRHGPSVCGGAGRVGRLPLDAASRPGRGCHFDVDLLLVGACTRSRVV